MFQKVVAEVNDALQDYQARLPQQAPRARAILADARNIIREKIGTVDAVVTSPPYLSAQDYYRSSKLEIAICGMWEPGIERTLGGKIIGSGRGGVLDRRRLHLGNSSFTNGCQIPQLSMRSTAMIREYLADMRRVLGRVRRCMRRDAKCCLVVGDSTIEGVQLPVHQWFINLAQSAGFDLFKHEVDLIRDRRVPPQREGHQSVIDREHVLFFRKVGRKSSPKT